MHESPSWGEGGAERRAGDWYAEEESPAFPELSAFFDTGTVHLRTEVLEGIALVRVGRHPLARLIGECWREELAGDDCPYAISGLSIAPSVGDWWDALCTKPQARALARLGAKAFRAYQEALCDIYDVWAITSGEPIAIAMLSEHPIVDRVPVTLDLLEAVGGASRVRYSEAWEVLRILKDAFDIVATQVQLSCGGHVGRDLAVHRDRLNRVEARRLGTLKDLQPILGGGYGALPSKWRHRI